jgi:hypothetical protein
MTRGEEWAAEFGRVNAGNDEGEAFHGASLRSVMAAMDAAAARARPVAAGHNAAEILEHVIAWREWESRILEGEGKVNPEADGWIRVDALDEPAWEALRNRVEASAERLSGAVRRLDGRKFSKHRDRLRFLLHHDLAHGGQVALLRRAGG